MFRFSAFFMAASLTLCASVSAESYHFNRPGVTYGAPRISGGYGGGFAHGGGFGGGMGYAGGMSYGYGGHFGGHMGGYHMQAMPVQQYLVPVTYRVPVFIAPPVRPAAPACPTGCDTAPQIHSHGE